MALIIFWIVLCLSFPLEHVRASRTFNFSAAGEDGSEELNDATVLGDGGTTRRSALYVFGDSIVDSGNNNYLNNYAKANFIPYGKDFDTHQATGRFSNGRLVPDFLAAYMEIDFPSPYLASSTDIQQGANFASAGSGLLDSIGSGLGDILAFSEQVQYFQAMKQRLKQNLGETSANDLMANAIVYVSIAHNDIANNYYASSSPPQTIDQFEKNLIDILSKHIQILYNEGVRKFVFESLLPLGCAPTFSGASSSCANYLVEAARNYNALLETFLAKQRSTFIGAHFLLANGFDLISEIAQDPQKYGFITSFKPCCGNQAGGFGGGFCSRGASTCPNDSEYVFWDMLHPTSKIYSMLASRYWSGATSDISPINISKLVAL